MKPETFFDNFEVLADAPNGVQKLRELILQLAVRGKLVAQDEKDEPASILLKNIKANQIKTSYNPVEEYEMPYDLPKKWEWVRLGEILASLPSSKRCENGKYPVYGSNGIVGYHDKFLIDKPSIIVGRKGSCGALNICLEPSWPTDVSYFIIPPVEIDLKFAYILLKSLNLEKLGKGIKPGLNRNEAYLLVTSLPPFNEQHRIISKVDQLMSLCDELEVRQQKKRETRAHINSAALDRLLAARAPGEFAEGWRCISDNFDLLYDEPENVGALRQAILQLAVMGKLVEQDENDEPAEVLMEKIKDENKIQIKNQKNKNTPLVSPIRLTPFELPKNWKWCRMGEIAEIMMGNSPPGDSYNENGNDIPLINGPVEFSKGPFGYTNKTKFTTKPTKLCEENDLLICVRGSTTGRTNIAGFPACIGRGVAAIRARIHQQYVNYLVLSMRQQIYDLGTGSTFPSVSYGQLMELPIPLPPLTEQRRIVARVDQLMSLCDKLEAGLMSSQVDSERLMEGCWRCKNVWFCPIIIIRYEYINNRKVYIY